MTAAGSVLLHGISTLVTNDPEAGPGLLGRIPDAALIIDEDRIGWVGPAHLAPAADTEVDLGDRAVLPGWVDSHTHLVFAGDRADEFAARMAGTPYEAGGIRRTVAATRAATDEELVDLVRARLTTMARWGTTCVEIKTGYGLSVRDEGRLARIAAGAGADEVTFLGAHVVPEEFADDPDGYLDLVCGPMLDAVAGSVRFIDVFCEDGAFDDARSRRVLAAGERVGLLGKVHGNQLQPGPGVLMAVTAGAVSVDHCTYLAPEDIDALTGSQTVATLLPTCDLSTRHPPAPGRALVDAGVAIALASDCNPGTSATSSMALVVALGVLQCGLTTDEAVYAATAGGAKALRRDDVGRIAVGMRADLHVLDAPAPEHLAYHVGMPLTRAVWRRGVPVPDPGQAGRPGEEDRP